MKQSEQVAAQLDKKVDQLEALLPQTQCTQCGFSGCRPYAEALINNTTTTNKCIPGGRFTQEAIHIFLQIKEDENNNVSDIKAKVAVIDEEKCVGCYKCIEVCPVDAIIGAHGYLHTVDEKYCTGCKLCIEPCPVDCIDLLEVSKKLDTGQLVINGLTSEEKRKAANDLKSRYNKKQHRPPLRQALDNQEFNPVELANKAMNRAQRRKTKAN